MRNGSELHLDSIFPNCFHRGNREGSVLWRHGGVPRYGRLYLRHGKTRLRTFARTYRCDDIVAGDYESRREGRCSKLAVERNFAAIQQVVPRYS